MSQTETPERLIYSDEARKRVGVGRTRFSEIINDPAAQFPRPVKVGVRHAFIESELNAWLRNRPRVPIKPKPATQPEFFDASNRKRAAARARARAAQAGTDTEGARWTTC